MSGRTGSGTRSRGTGKDQDRKALGIGPVTSGAPPVPAKKRAKALIGLRKLLKEAALKAARSAACSPGRLRQLRAYTLEASTSMVAHVYAGILQPEELIAIQCAMALLTYETFLGSTDTLFFGRDAAGIIDELKRNAAQEMAQWRR